jgi:hypothetical protein
VRLNALTHGLRARSTLISNEKQEEYEQFWDQLVAEWHPQGRTELLYLETVCTSQWLLARVANSERKIYEDLKLNSTRNTFICSPSWPSSARSWNVPSASPSRISSSRKRSGNPSRRPSRSRPLPIGRPAKQPAQSPVHPPTYVMAEPAEAHPVFCAPINPDTR